MSEFNPFTLRGKTILVTGASSGIGRGIAIACSKMGANLILTGRNKIKLDETLSLLGEGQHLSFIADLTVLTDIVNLVSKFPKLDGIVHCAGMGHRKICKQIEEKDVDSVMSINFKAPVMLQTEILKQKKLNKSASIVFIASVASETPSTGNAVYSASKGALISYSKCLELELAPRGIRVNCISPAMIWTDLIFKGGLSEVELREDEKKYPLKRYGRPEDIANLAIYLLSDASEWMTGSNVKISGGF